MATGLTARLSADCWIQSSPVERLSSREHAQGSENQLSFHCDGTSCRDRRGTPLYEDVDMSAVVRDRDRKGLDRSSLKNKP